MACTYDLTTEIGRVRRDIGDTDCSGTVHYWEDEEIQSFLDEATLCGWVGFAHVKGAAGLTLIAWAVALAREDELVRTGSWTGDRRDVAGKMNAKAQEYLDMAGPLPSEAPAFLSVPVDWDSTVAAERELTDE
ncbi:MAG TPA: hypothetical protein VFH61_16845 [Thermoleophilia bacterium]|nr:hypothetical protein [Thermoleophilia bacterium]